MPEIKMGDTIEVPEEKVKKAYNYVLDMIQRAEGASEDSNNRCMKWYQLWRSWLPKELRRAGRSNIVVPKVFSLVETICPIDVAALLSIDPPLQVLPTEGKDAEGAPLWERVINKYLEDARWFWFLLDADKSKVMYGDSFGKIFWDKHSRIEEYSVPQFANLGGFQIPMGNTTQVGEVVHYDGIGLDMIERWDMIVPPHIREVVKNGRPCDFIGDRTFQPQSTIREWARKDIYNSTQVEKALKKDAGRYLNTWHQEKLNKIGLTDYQPHKGKMPEVIECWFMYDLQENGTYQHFVMTLVNRQWVRFQLNGFRHGLSPYIHFIHTRDPKQFWNVGAIEPVEKLAQETNAKRNLRLDNSNLLQNVMWKKRHHVDSAQLISAPNNIINVLDPDDVEMVVPPMLPPDEMQVVMDRDFDEASGIAAWRRGGHTPRTETATMATFLEAAADAKAKLPIMMMEQGAIPHLGFMVRKLIDQFGTTELSLRIAGSTGGYTFQKVSPEELARYGDMDYKCIGSQSFGNKMMRAQQLQNLIKLIFSNPQLMLFGNPYSFLRDALVLMDIKDWESKLWKPEIVQAMEQIQQQLIAQEEATKGGTSGLTGNEMETGQARNIQEVLRNLARTNRPEVAPNLLGEPR